MLKPIFLGLILLPISMSAMAEKCICQDNAGNGKRQCSTDVVQCKTFCGSMSMSYGGACGGIVLPPLPIGQFRVEALTETLWNDSKTDVLPGEVLSIKTIGVHGWQTNQYWIAGGADGHPQYKGSASYLLPGGAEGALVGRVGSGTVFMIGSNGKTPAGATGRLFIGGNDEPSGRFDNRGNIIVEINKIEYSQ